MNLRLFADLDAVSHHQFISAPCLQRTAVDFLLKEGILFASSR